jgi:hypothetical protein
MPFGRSVIVLVSVVGQCALGAAKWIFDELVSPGGRASKPGKTKTQRHDKTDPNGRCPPHQLIPFARCSSRT